MSRLVPRLSTFALLCCTAMLAGCGSSGSASTEAGAIDNLRSVLTSYNSSAPTNVATTGSACATALSGLQNSNFLAAPPTSGKEFGVRRDLHEAYMQARQGFSDCATGATTMDYALMARGDAELTSANQSLQRARTPGG